MSELRYIEISKIHPHPDNPRKNVGDVTELAESIKVNGILQNLTLVPFGEEYRVIIGHRRLAGAKLAGLTEVPCVVREMTPQEQVKTMLMENIQRSDLTVYEQAQGFQMMLDMGETIESIAKDSGFSQTTVRRRVKLLDLDAERFRKSEARGATLQDYMELDKIDDPDLKNKALDAIGTANFRDELKKAIEADKMTKRMEQWEKDLSAFALKIEQRGYVGSEPVQMDYVENFASYTKTKVVQKPDDAGTVKYFYRVGNEDISLYKEHQEHEETNEERQRKEEQAAFDRRVNELEEITERHFSLRSEFICDFSAAKKNILPICAFAAKKLFDKCTSFRYTLPLDHELLGELLDLDIDSDSDYDTLWASCDVELNKATEYTLLALVYYVSDGDKNGYWKREWLPEERRWALCYEPNDDLDHLYDFLISLGYEMSDEEKAMQNGQCDLLESAKV